MAVFRIRTYGPLSSYTVRKSEDRGDALRVSFREKE